jgi:tetratricopeptide (TPR) repeat protein
MKIGNRLLVLAVVLAGFASAQLATAEGSVFDNELLSIQRAFDYANFSGLSKSERKRAFGELVESAADFSARYSSRVEAVAWNGIVLSTYAGEVSALSAMKYAKAARTALHDAEAMAPMALDGGIYASLGALYSKVPGGMVGFGDDELAASYFAKALEIDPDNIDSNFFYGEFLIEQEQYDRAITVLQRALAAPAVASRPLFDAGRRETIRDLLESAKQQAS